MKSKEVTMAKVGLLFVEIKHTISTDTYTYKTNIKKESVSDIVSEFLRGQIGQGADKSKVNKQDTYTIRITVDLSYDTFRCIHDCGNLGLRDGILMYFLKAWDQGEVKTHE
jgi:hypothetical protein